MNADTVWLARFGDKGWRDHLRKAAQDYKFHATLKPRLDQAVEAAIQAGGFDLVLDRSAVVDVKAEYDITRQVIERLNSIR